MCLAIPARVDQIDGEMARLQVGDADAYINACLSLLPEPAEVGDYVIVHAGFAMHKLDKNEAQETIKLLREMASLLEDDGVLDSSGRPTHR